MPILGTSSTEPYQCGRFRYGCHNSYVPVVWAYPSSVTGKARNPLPSGRLFMVVQARHRQCAICLPTLRAKSSFTPSLAAGTHAHLASKAPVVCQHQPRFPYCPCARCLTEGLHGANVQQRDGLGAAGEPWLQRRDLTGGFQRGQPVMSMPTSRAKSTLFSRFGDD